MLGAFLVVFFSRSWAPVFIGIMGVGLFMATIYTTALALGTASIKGNDLGVSTMIFIGSTGGIITPAVVGMVAEKAGHGKNCTNGNSRKEIYAAGRGFLQADEAGNARV